MSRASVRAYVTTILTNAISDIVIEPNFPKAEAITDIAFIQSLTQNEDRVAMPRGGGRKDVTYNITMMAMTSDVDEAKVPVRMDAMLEEIFQVLRTTALNVVVTDSTTHRTGHMIKVGEHIRVISDAVFQLMSTQGNEAEVMESVGFTFDLVEQIVA